MLLSNLKNKTRNKKQSKRVGRGPGSGMGKTCGRGYNGAGSRSGYKRRYGYEGGGLPLYMRLPCRGFNNARFAKRYHAINLEQINVLFNDGDVVNVESLRQHGFLSGPVYGIKILGNGKLTKKVTIEAHAFSKKACEQLTEAKVSFTTINVKSKEK